MKRKVRVSGSFAYHTAKQKSPRSKQRKHRAEDAATRVKASAFAVPIAIRITITTSSVGEAESLAKEMACRIVTSASQSYPDAHFSHLTIGEPAPMVDAAVMRRKA